MSTGTAAGTATSTGTGTGTERATPAELRTLFLFEGLSDDQLAWIAERARVRAFDAGAAVFTEGEPAEALWVLVDGGVRLSRRSAGEELVTTETSHRGAYAGATRAYVAGGPAVYQTSMVATAPSRFLRLAAEDFATFMHEHLPMAVHLLDGLYVGVRAGESVIRQREHLAQLGSLSANLAHELNNPASAAVRATGQLRERVAGMRHKLGLLASGGVDPEAISRMVVIQDRILERVVKAAAGREPLSALEESDLEDALADRLDDLGVAGALDLAPVFAAARLDAECLDEVAEEVGEGHLDPAFRWLAYALETEALMDEIEDASTRISTMVGAVKQYSRMDSAGADDVDLRPGLDATVVMLGHALGGITVERDYDPDLPTVRGYPAELNQVWTNLIDNAAAAMAGRGTLRLRTRRDGDEAVVEVADTGPGVPEAVRQTLFEPFVTTKGPGEGSGLGLDNARRIVEKRHRGSITFDSTDAGTTFAVRLPLRAGA